MGEVSVPAVRGETSCCHGAGRLPVKTARGGRVMAAGWEPLVVAVRRPLDGSCGRWRGGLG